MTRDESKNSCSKLLLQANSRHRAELLRNQLLRVDDTLDIRLTTDKLENIKAEDLHDQTILSIYDQPETAFSWFEAAKKLRTEHLYWCPVHICVAGEVSKLDVQNDWGIYLHKSPPDPFALAKSLRDSTSLSLIRRREIIYAGLTSIANEIISLVRNLSPNQGQISKRIKIDIQQVLSLMSSRKVENRFTEVCKELERLQKLGSIEENDATGVIPLVVTTENELRDEIGLEQIASAFHRLNNGLRLMINGKVDFDSVTKNLLIKINSTQARGIDSLPEALSQKVRETLASLSCDLQAIQTSNFDNLRQEKTISATSALYKIAGTVKLSSEKTRSKIERIILIEDDDDWRDLIRESLESIAGQYELPVFTAKSISEARELLSSSKPTLSLVDLGLPLEAGDVEITLNGGLSLIKQFSGSNKSGKQFQHRFIILTAAENFTQAVKEAATFGISAYDYIKKIPGVWHNELLARMRLALQPSRVKLPRIEIFKRTGRIARIDSCELILDYPLWCLLAVLADSRQGIWNEPEKIAHILYWNYALNPESRSGSTEDLDPEERIILQLPHYTSELNKKMEAAYLKAANEPLSERIVLFDSEVGYRLNANAEILDQVERHFKVGKKPCVLIVEDDSEWVKEIEGGLRLRGFDTLVARSTEEATDIIKSKSFDLVSLDLELPISSNESSGEIPRAENTVNFLRNLRRDFPNIPVAVLSSIAWRDGIMLEMLRQGVRIDDYLSKNNPNPVETLAFSLARLWQEIINETQILDWDSSTPLHPIVIEPGSVMLTSVAGYRINPTGKGATILKALSATPNVFISRTELIEIVYGSEDVDSLPDDIDNALNSHLKRLRKTITENTGGNAPGEQIVCGDRGVYWLRGIVQ